MIEISTLSTSSSSGEGSLVFETVFLIVWLGSGVVAVNGKLLGGNISFFQSVCVVGYCLFPLNLAALLLLCTESFLPGLLRFAIVALAFGWSTYASMGFIHAMVPENKRLLAAYPVCLFFLFLSWFILL